MTARPDERIHTLLCASLFGEVTEAERAELEAGLKASSELRAERDRLAATVGLVQESFGEEPRLSDSTVAKLVDEAVARRASVKPGPKPAPQLRLLRSPMLRAAAAVVVTVGGVVGTLRFMGGSQAPDELVARRDPIASLEALGEGREQAEPELSGTGYAGKVDSNELDGMVALGYTGDPAGDVPAAEPSLPSQVGFEASRKDDVAVVDGVEAPKEQALEGVVPIVEIPIDGTWIVAGESLGDKASRDAFDNAVSQELGGLSAPEAEERPVFRDFEAPARDEAKKGEGLAVVGGSLHSNSPESELPSSSEVGPASPAPVVSGAPGTPSLRADGESNARLLRLREKAKDGGERFRGPGDTVPPGGGTAEAARGSSSSVVPGTPGTPGPTVVPHRQQVAASETLNDGRVAGELDAELLEQLKALGYSAADDESDLLADSPFDEDSFFLGKGVRGRTDIDSALERMRREGDVEGLRRYADDWCERTIRECRRRPREVPRDMYFRYWGDNAFELSQIDHLSTFAVDVDTASYALARRYLADGHLPEKAQIRTEEFVNYFTPDLAPPTEGDFAIHTELAPSLFGGREDRWMLRVGVRGREIPREERKPLVLTFVVDTSGSMKEDARLELVKHSLRLLVSQLDERDRIGVVAFSNDARLILPLTSASERGLIESALHPLSPKGSTNAEGGLRMGYELALAALDAEAINRVVFLSDGVANVGQTDQERILADVRQHREAGIYLNTIGVGMDNHNDVFLEQLANKGDGVCDYVDTEAAVRRAIVDRFTGAFQPIASDVKIQVDFDSTQVHRWRLLGYENRAVADADFRNDAVDAGEIGSGHQVVALYEIERTTAPKEEPELGEEVPLATVHLRWKQPKAPGQDPNEIDVNEIERGVKASEAVGSFGATSAGYRRSALVAQFAEFLRRSSHTQGDRYSDLVAACESLERELKDPEFSEFTGMVRRAADLILRAHRSRFELRSELDRAIDAYRWKQIRRAELECLERADTHELIERVERESDQLEEDLRELMRRRVIERRG